MTARAFRFAPNSLQSRRSVVTENRVSLHLVLARCADEVRVRVYLTINSRYWRDFMRYNLLAMAALLAGLAVAGTVSYGNMTSATAPPAAYQTQSPCCMDGACCPDSSCCTDAVATGKQSCSPDGVCCPESGCCLANASNSSAAGCCPDGGCCPLCCPMTSCCLDGTVK